MKQYLLLIGIAITVAGCSESDTSKDAEKKHTTESQHMNDAVPHNEMNRKMNFAQITRGGKVYQQNCMSCHGINAEGHTTWRKRDSEGKHPAPPLNGTGHAWHHSNKVNKNTIRNGTKHIGGNMPAWKDKLTEQEIEDVIAWFQSKWSDRVYWTWYEKVENKK